MFSGKGESGEFEYCRFLNCKRLTRLADWFMAIWNEMSYAFIPKPFLSFSCLILLRLIKYLEKGLQITMENDISPYIFRI